MPTIRNKPITLAFSSEERVPWHQRRTLPNFDQSNKSKSRRNSLERVQQTLNPGRHDKKRGIKLTTQTFSTRLFLPFIIKISKGILILPSAGMNMSIFYDRALRTF